MASFLTLVGRLFEGYTSAISLAYADEQAQQSGLSEEALERARQRMAVAPWWF